MGKEKTIVSRFDATLALITQLEERLEVRQAPVIYDEEIYRATIKQMTGGNHTRYYVSDVQFLDIQQAAEFVLIVPKPDAIDRVVLRDGMVYVQYPEEMSFVSLLYNPARWLQHDMLDEPFPEEVSGIRFVIDRIKLKVYLIGVV